MKRTFLALVLLTALVFALFLPGAAGTDYSGIYCVAVNERVLLDLLTAETMPFYSGGVLYVPATVFDGSKTDVPFEINGNHNREIDTFTLFTRQRTIIFQISGGYSRDSAGTRYSDHVVSRNGNIFVPVRFVCTFFGLTYSYLTVETAGGTVPIIRITNDLMWLTNEQFMPPAIDVVEGPVANYYRNMTAPPTQTTTTPPTQTTPGPGQPTDRRDVRVYFAFALEDDLAGLDDVLSSLAAQRISALFLFPPSRLTEWDDAVRRVMGGGHRVGFLLGDAPEEEYAEGARLLAHIARAESRIVALPSGGSADPDWVLWRSDIDGRTGTSTARATAVLTAVATRRGSAWITLDGSSASAGALTRILSGLVTDHYDLQDVTETALM